MQNRWQAELITVLLVMALLSCKQSVWDVRNRAENGDVSAQMKLGDEMYGDASKIQSDKNYAEAAKWYRMAAEQGCAKAQYRMSNLSGLGWGVPRNEIESMKWLRKAAEQGDVWSQRMMYTVLANHPLNSRDTAEAYIEAYKWFSLQAQNHEVEEVSVPEAWSESSFHVKGLQMFMTPTQIAEAKKRVLEWKPVPKKSCGE